MSEQFIPGAKLMLDSISEDGHRLTTIEATFHRFVLAEFNTHRVLSRNSASSRAIPVSKQLAKVSSAPAFPVEWPCERPGMQGGSHLEGWDLQVAQTVFEDFQFITVDLIDTYLQLVADHYGLSWDSKDPEEIRVLKSHTLHKSLLNRLIEPIMSHTAIVTGSGDWSNFLNQRVSPLAQPEFRVVAEAIEEILATSEPTLLRDGEWHTPYILPEEKAEWDVEKIKQVSTARCARVSYLTHDGVRDPNEDLRLYRDLASADPRHWSPTEHIATPEPSNVANVYQEAADNESEPVLVGQVPVLGNFVGFQQFRHEGKFWEPAA